MTKTALLSLWLPATLLLGYHIHDVSLPPLLSYISGLWMAGAGLFYWSKLK